MKSIFALAVLMLASCFAGAETTTVTNEGSICRTNFNGQGYCEAAPASDGSSVSFSFTPAATFTFHNVTYDVTWTQDSEGYWNAMFPLGSTRQGLLYRTCRKVGRGITCRWDNQGGVTTLN
jgi:hypothetical protein